MSHLPDSRGMVIASELETEGLRGDLRRGEMVGEQTVMFIRMIIINQSVDSQQPNMCSLLICPGAGRELRLLASVYA